VPEGRQLFPYLSVTSNLKLGATVGVTSRALEFVGVRLRALPSLEGACQTERRYFKRGEQQMLAIARAHASPSFCAWTSPP
jgi:ABC-type branched-subunit amino acid transport system ATPase component